MIKKQRLTLLDYTPQQDIKYRGPLSYRGIRVIAWICIILSQIAIVLGLFSRYKASIDPEASQRLAVWNTILSNIGEASISLLLVANFALILQSREHIIILVFSHLISFIALYLLFMLFYKRYLYGFFYYIFKDSAQAMLDTFISKYFTQYLSFNVFVDLLMCSSTYMFLVYTPKHHFQGKKLILFRLLAILPIGYELACRVLAGLANGYQLFSLPIWALPLFPTKGTFMFFAFIAIILFVKFRKRKYLSRGKTLDDYNQYLFTNANSLSFSLAIASTFALAAVLDAAVSIGVGVVYTYHYQPLLAPESSIAEFFSEYGYSFLNAWGLGSSITLILGVPFILLFSYTKRHSEATKILDMLLPLISIALIIFVYLEGLLAFLHMISS